VDELETLLAHVSKREPAAAATLDRVAAASGVPEDYVSFMTSSNGGDGDVGRA
jgi:hypothetical protein